MQNLIAKLAVLYLNMGLMMGLTFGALILLRPVTGRLLRPQHQVVLWQAGWLVSVLSAAYSSLGRLQLLPVTFRSLVVPRVDQRLGNVTAYPAFFWNRAGTEAPLMLPGGTEVAIPRYETLLAVLTVVWLAAMVGIGIWLTCQEGRLKRLGRAGERMDRETMKEYGITDRRVAVRLCENLPTSFVRRGHDTGRKDGIRAVICLQKELPPERMRLVLLHEMEHIRLKHPAYKCTIVVGVTMFFWWNPILWLACRLTCRDMELACDEAVLARLEPEERRDYARTLVELGSGRHLWGSVTSFGECDAALRVRRAARWKPAREEAVAFSLLLASVMFVFFFCGGPVYESWEQVPSQWPEYLESGAWVDQVAQKLEKPGWQPREVWSKTPEALVVLDQEGQWYSFSFVSWTGEEYRWVQRLPHEAGLSGRLYPGELTESSKGKDGTGMELLDYFFHSYFNLFLNLGLWCGIVMGIILLLRPVLCRLLTPGQRVFLWGVAWVGGFAPQMFSLLARIDLPVPTLRSLLIPRAERGYPLFLPVMQEAGTYRLVLPGGATIPFSITQEGIEALGWLGLLFLAVTFLLAVRSDWGVKRMARSGTELDREQYRRLRVDQEDNLVVRLCPNLPTSFVVRSWGRHEIALQKELTEEQLRLVLLHEREHVRRHDPWLQGLAVVVVCFHFWNPVIWLAYHFTRRDMELACDRRVLRNLGEEERRAYAHTLVDLACDKPRWGGLTTFGECDASRRVRAAARWAPEDESDDWEPRRLLGWAVVVLLAASLFLGGPWERAVTGDLVSDLERDGGWTWLAGEMAERNIVPDEEEPLWIRGDGSSYAKIYILDEEGTWWSALIRRSLYRGHLDAHLSPMTIPDTPDLSGCDPISWEETEGTSGAA